MSDDKARKAVLLSLIATPIEFSFIFSRNSEYFILVIVFGLKLFPDATPILMSESKSTYTVT